MEFQIRESALPTIYQAVKGKPIDISREGFILSNAKITALHFHDVLEIGVCISGSGQTHIDNRIYNYKQGYCQIIPAGVAHLSTADDKSKWSWVSIKLPDALSKAGITDPQDLLQLTNQNNIFCGVFSPEEYPTLARNILRIVEICMEKSQFWQNQSAFAIGDLLIESSKITLKNNEHKPKTHQKFTNKKIEILVDYITENIEDNEKLTENILAKNVKVSVSTLRRIFTIHTGFSPKEFVLRTKMALAEWLLAESNLTITDICLKVGYADPSGFNRIFKKFYNYSPIKYRKFNKR